MSEQNGIRFDVYALDMWTDGEGGWTENARSRIGSVELPANRIEEVTDLMILKALNEVEFADFMGQRYHPLATKDRRLVYAEDYYGSGEWWEVGFVKRHEPVFGLVPAA